MESQDPVRATHFEGAGMPLSMLPRYHSPYGASGRSSKPSGQRSSPGMRKPPPRRSMVARSFSGSRSGTRGAHRFNAAEISSTVASGIACTGCAPVASLNAAYAPSRPTRARPTRSPGSKSRVRAARAMRSFMVFLVLC
ncbi:hypothetical protein D9M72_518090 [compost metagenome]